jgi:hypothetical protein
MFILYVDVFYDERQKICNFMKISIVTSFHLLKQRTAVHQDRERKKLRKFESYEGERYRDTESGGGWRKKER